MPRRKKLLHIYLDPEVKARLEALARKQGRTVADLVREGIATVLERWKDSENSSLEVGNSEPFALKLHEPEDAEPIAWRDYGADRSLFWSSPEKLPLWMIICTVLRAGRSVPLFAILEKHGPEKPLFYLERLKESGLIRENVYQYMREWIEEWEKDEDSS